MMRARGRLIAWVTAASALLGAAPVMAEMPNASAVVVMYHRFGETSYPSTNIRLDQFEAHIAELKSGRYNVMALPDVIAAFARGAPLPDRTVAITIDDAYESTFREAWPRLKQAGLPFTVFVATDPVDKVKGYMTWDQIRALVADGVTIAAHTDAHGSLVARTPEQVAGAIARGAARIAAETGQVPTLFAYPFGEYSLAAIREVERAGFAAAFGRHSGVAHNLAPRFTLPRFALNETYGEAARFRSILGALPFPVTDVTPAETLVTPADNPPALGFSVAPEIGSVAAMGCWTSTGRARIERIERRIEVRSDRPFPPGRARFNCTLQTPEGRSRWFGVQFVVAPSR